MVKVNLTKETTRMANQPPADHATTKNRPTLIPNSVGSTSRYQIYQKFEGFRLEKCWGAGAHQLQRNLLGMERRHQIYDFAQLEAKQVGAGLAFVHPLWRRFATSFGNRMKTSWLSKLRGRRWEKKGQGRGWCGHFKNRDCQFFLLVYWFHTIFEYFYFRE
jgi:hypothetical protein